MLYLVHSSGKKPQIIIYNQVFFKNNIIFISSYSINYSPSFNNKRIYNKKEREPTSQISWRFGSGKPWSWNKRSSSTPCPGVNNAQTYIIHDQKLNLPDLTFRIIRLRRSTIFYFSSSFLFSFIFSFLQRQMYKKIS